MDVIIRRANRPVRILMKSGMVVDGKEGTIAVDTKAFVKDASRDQLAETGDVSVGKSFYIPPMKAGRPSLPCQIEYMGRFYDIIDIKVYTDLRGVCKGYRMVVAGG